MINEVRNVYFVSKQNEVEDCFQYLKHKKVLSLDIETTRRYNNKYGKLEGLDPYLSDIVMLQIGDLQRQYILDIRKVHPKKILSLLEDKNIVIVGHNLKFEYKHLLHKYRIRLTNIYDTMIVEQILFNGFNYSNSLKSLIFKYLKEEVIKETRLEFLYIKDTPFSLKQKEYGADDIIAPLLIRNIQLPEIIEKGVSKCVSLELEFVLVLGDIEYKGIHFNKDKWKKNYIKNIEIVEKYTTDLNAYILDNFLNTEFVDKQYSLFEESFKCTINWDSPKQVKSFFSFIGIKPLEKSKTTGKQTITIEAKALESYIVVNKVSTSALKFTKLYLDYKKYKKAITSFGLGFFKYIHPITNRIHSNYKQILHTGRISSFNPNVQNIPSDLSYRSAFTSPEGFRIINADYSGQEQIILANKTQDKDLLSFYTEGHSDMHSFIASKIYSELKDVSLGDIKKFHKDKRQIAKSAGFAINYGGNGFTISKNLGIPVQKGEEVYDAYFEAFAGLKAYFKQVHREATDKGYILIDKITGRKYWYNKYQEMKECYSKGNLQKYFKLKHTLEKAAQNFPIQGEAGSITKYAAILFRNWIISNNLQDEIYITMLVHDEIGLEVKTACAKTSAEKLTYYMEQAGKLWCKIIPLKADSVITKFWTH